MRDFILKKANYYFSSRHLLYTVTSFLLFTLFLISIFFYIQFKKFQINQDLIVAVSRVEQAFISDMNNTEFIMNMINSQIREDYNNKKHISNILSKFRTNSRVSNQLSWTIFSWVDKNNFMTVDAVYGILKNPIDISARSYIESIKSKLGKMVLGEPIIGSTSYKWMISGGVGNIDERGDFIGYMVIGFELKRLLLKLNDVAMNSRMKDIFLLDNKLNILTDSKVVKYQNYDLPLDNKNFGNNLKKIVSNNDEQQLVVVSLWGSSYIIHKIPETPYIILIIYND